ncbi:MAG: CHAT domain-containing protein [Lewinellaceae bacterium]|nr:CHAT domain-containing protein [Lewinellaceae bacterium]
MFNDELSEKGQLIYSARTVLAALQASGDSLLISRFKQWRDQKQSIAYYYSLPSHQRLFTPLELDSIVQVANLTEASLVQGSDAFRTARAKVNWQNVRDGLQPGEAAIEFTRFRYRNGLRLTDSVYYAALVLRRGDRDPVFVKLFEEKQLAGFLQNCASRAADYKEYVGLAYRGPRLTTLYQLIWQPLESLLTDVHTVWYAPTGLLHRIAFDAIAPETGRPLVKKYDLRLVSSTREVVSNRKLTRDVVQTALLVGGIHYDADSLCLVRAAKGLDSLPVFLPAPSLTVQRGSCENGPVTDIPGTKKETDLLVSKLQSRMYVRLLQGCSAREEAIKRCGDPEKPDAPGLMHIATHGFFCDDPESSAPGKPRLFRSGLLLAGAQRARTGKPPFQGMEDGILYSSEVANLNLTGTKLVVLSACETALGDVRGGDGVYGLPRGFRLAGAEHVMMSLWKISDSETVLFMETLYRHWQPETDIRAAFLATQRELQAAGKGEEVWAAFILL